MENRLLILMSASILFSVRSCDESVLSSCVPPAVVSLGLANGGDA